MKVNTDSWHYNVMAFYKWSRFDYSDFDTSYPLHCWARQRGMDVSIENPDKSFHTFKEYMIATGRLQPMDFCSYWRNVLVWPLLRLAYWAFVLTAVVIALSQVSFTGITVSFFTIVASLACAGLVVYLCLAYDNFKAKRKERQKEDGFFKNVNKALKNPTICTLMEYETQKDAE
ncbi:hypothetical protein PHIN3_400 [Sinorhizobium phage phiN3]|uniref:Transmembrane protein n=1 Tax=Sinorhizobium phage phiN3 TaxID=1647405 RepID=A0A0F6SJ65_9CAUD|nr:hypothetical protein AVT40_gp133 [Sinorhizobium phage phiN3]AKF13663.1 hypothetical protein PHIN3_400 [Sinorhizobium phage phiN3]